MMKVCITFDLMMGVNMERDPMKNQESQVRPKRVSECVRAVIAMTWTPRRRLTEWRIYTEQDNQRQMEPAVRCATAARYHSVPTRVHHHDRHDDDVVSCDLSPLLLTAARLRPLVPDNHWTHSTLR